MRDWREGKKWGKMGKKAVSGGGGGRFSRKKSPKSDGKITNLVDAALCELLADDLCASEGEEGHEGRVALRVALNAHFVLRRNVDEHVGKRGEQRLLLALQLRRGWLELERLLEHNRIALRVEILVLHNGKL